MKPTASLEGSTFEGTHALLIASCDFYRTKKRTKDTMLSAINRRELPMRMFFVVFEAQTGLNIHSPLTIRPSKRQFAFQ
jgi:hypothetical protein